MEGLKKNAVVWEGKYSECLSKNDNLEKMFSDEREKVEMLKEKLIYVEMKKDEAVRKSENLLGEVERMGSIVSEKNSSMEYLQERVVDLEKSNEIIKYRVVELKASNDPKEAEIGKMKDNLNDLEDEYDKLLKSAQDGEQKSFIMKRENAKLRQSLEALMQKEKRTTHTYEDLIEKVRDATKSPIQSIRKELLSILNTIAIKQRSRSCLAKERGDSPLGELNRIRAHLE